MKREIKNRIDEIMKTIIDKKNCYIEILNIDEALDKVVPVFDSIYSIVPREDIFVPKLIFSISLFPIENLCLHFSLNFYRNPMPKALLYESSVLKADLLSEDSLFKDLLGVYLSFASSFGEKYNHIALQFIPGDVKDLNILKDRTYFSIPLEVIKEKYMIWSSGRKHDNKRIHRMRAWRFFSSR